MALGLGPDVRLQACRRTSTTPTRQPVRARVLAALAHDPVGLVPGLPVHPPGRCSRVAPWKIYRNLLIGVHPVRPVARGLLELRVLGASGTGCSWCMERTAVGKALDKLPRPAAPRLRLAGRGPGLGVLPGRGPSPRPWTTCKALAGLNSFDGFAYTWMVRMNREYMAHAGRGPGWVRAPSVPWLAVRLGRAGTLGAPGRIAAPVLLALALMQLAAGSHSHPSSTPSFKVCAA